MLADNPDDVDIISLGASHSDDDLWWIPRVVRSGESLQFEMAPGPLIDAPNEPPGTVLIPDLANVSLAVARAAVTVIGADAVVADRYGQHASWRPRSRWLAGCARSDLARLSPHLLDRFCVRVDVSNMWLDMSPEAIRAAIDRDTSHDSPDLLSSPLPRTGLWRVTPRFPRLTAKAVETVMATMGAAQAATRRDLALARLSRDIAWLRASDTARSEHVFVAAAIMGLAPISPRVSDPVPRREQEPALPMPADDSPWMPPERQEAPGPAASTSGPAGAAVGGGIAAAGSELTAPVLLDPATPGGLLESGIYPEDDPGSIPEYASLRESWQRAEPAPGRCGGMS